MERIPRLIILLALLVPFAGTAAPLGGAAFAEDPPLTLEGRISDYANILDPRQKAEIERVATALERATGDVVVVATVTSFKPYGDIREYAVKLFENGGRGIGLRGKDNGVLVLVAVNERRVWIEVGYGLEEFVTDGFAGETAREYMVPFFRNGDYAGGIHAGVSRIVARIASGRGVTLEEVPAAATRRPADEPVSFLPFLILGIVLIWIISARLERRARYGPRGRFRGRIRDGGWTSGVGPFGGGFAGFGGGFGGFSGGGGGFGGGRSGGGGGGAGW